MRLPLTLSALAIAGSALAQDPQTTIPPHKFATPPTIDGAVDDVTEWKDVPSFSGLYDQESGATAPENGTFWLAYDADFIYFAARLVDSQPGRISANEYRTNVSLFGDDFVSLMIDPAGKLSDFSMFEMNSRGATNVALAGGTAAKREWSGDFQSKGRLTATGWEVEARIPWQILRLPAPGARDVRFNVFRYMPRNQKLYSHINTNGLSNAVLGKWQGVDVPPTQQVRTLKLLPYGYTGTAEDEDFIANGGLDLKMPITDQIQLVGTINPDFRNLENQILSLDFSRFERLAGDPRPFFQEGRNFLGNALFASQRIGQIDAGVNIFGKLNDRMSFGLLDTFRLKEHEENALVASGTYQINADSNVRASITSFDRDDDDIENRGYLIRYSGNFGPYNLFLRKMGTDDKQDGTGDEESINFNYFKDGLNFFSGYQKVSDDFRARLGFFPERDYKGWYAGSSYSKSFNSGPLLDYSFDVSTESFDHTDGSDYRSDTSAGFNVGLRSGLAFGMRHSDSKFEEDDDHLTSVDVSYPRGNSYRNVGLNYAWGELANEDFSNLGASATYRFGEKLQVSASYGRLKHFEEGTQTILSWNYDMGNDKFFSGRAVKTDDDWNAYFSYRRSGNQGMEYYFIVGDPNALKWRNSFIVKVVYPIEIVLGGGKKKAASKPA